MPTDLIDNANGTALTNQQKIVQLMREELIDQKESGGYSRIHLIDKYIDLLSNDSALTELQTLHELAAKGDETTAYAIAKRDGLEDIFVGYEKKFNELEKTALTESSTAPSTGVVSGTEPTAEQIKQITEQELVNQITNNTSDHYYIPGVGDQVETQDTTMYQSNPMLKMYSPRLLGAPPQLTNMCDMRLMSSYDDTHYGPVGDFYLTKILQNAQVCNFFVGRARFTGGVGSVIGIFNQAKNYLKALNTYNIYGETDETPLPTPAVEQETLFEAYNNSMGDNTETDFDLMTAGEAGYEDVDADTQVGYITGQSRTLIDSIGEKLISGGAALASQILTSLSVQQPFYTFEADWHTYINNVKMMINTAVIMLGLQKAPVRIGEKLCSIGMDVNATGEDDTWSNYRYITPTHGFGTRIEREDITGSTSQYVSVMVDGSSFTESYNNNVGDSQLFGAMKQGQSIGNEIAFLTNASVNKVDDVIIDLAQKGTNLAQQVITSLSAGVGRFAAAVVGGFAKSFTGDHTIYPQIWTDSNATQSVSFTVHLVSDGGDPYSYLINILVPLFYIMGMSLPRLSKNNASAYAFPPVIQANIPGLWGTRLGMITGLTVTKNPNGGDVSINGYPLSVDVQITIADLQHILMTSPMDQISTFLNNNTMFDYIAQCCGCDKYRVNPAVRLVSKLALAASAVRNGFNNLGDAIVSGANTWMNRKFGYSNI